MQIGDKVSWTKVSHSGHSISMRLREGVIVGLDGQVAKVKVSSGRVVEVAVNILRVKGQKSEISEFIETMRNKR